MDTFNMLERYVHAMLDDYDEDCYTENINNTYDDFKYKLGDKVILTGMVRHTEVEGMIITISGYRYIEPNDYCVSGRVYYWEEKTILRQCDYVYEERLQLYKGE